MSVTLLRALWLTSLLFSGASLCAVAGLVLYRALEERRERKRQRQRQRIEAEILEFLGGTIDRAQVTAVAASNIALTAEVGFGLAELVRGHDYEQLIALLRAVGVADMLRRKAVRGIRTARFAAVTTLRHFRDDASLATLRRALDDRDPEVSLAAAQSLAEIGALPPVAELIDKLRVGTEQRSQALQYIFRRLAHQQRGALAGLLAGDAYPVVKALALDALGHSGDYDVLASVMTASEAAEVELRAAAFRALANLGHPLALPAVANGLADTSWVVRSQAAVAAGRIGLGSLIPRLVELLGDPVWGVRFCSGKALLALGAAGLAAIIAASRGAPGSAARTAQIILTERGA